MKYNTLVMNIKREYFSSILSTPRRKTIEYRSLSSYWIKRLNNAGSAPFKLRLLNGMIKPVPEATIMVNKVVINKRTKEIELYLGKILEVKYWDRKLEKPIDN